MAYTAPAKDTVCIVGGLGTQAGASALNGGGATKTVWDAGTPSAFIGTNGGAIVAQTAVSYDHTGGTVEKMFSKAGIGTGVTVGTLAYISGTNITTGIYEVTTVAGDGSYIACSGIDATNDNSDSVVNVGGALATLQGALASPLNNGASYNRYIYDNIATEIITATIDVDTFGGSANTRIFVIGYNSTLAAEAQITITTASALASGLVRLNGTSAGAADYTEWKNITFNGGGVGKAEYCIYNAEDTASFNGFYNCNFHNADSNGVFVRGSTGYIEWFFINCAFYDNGKGGTGSGFSPATSNRATVLLKGCRFYSNPTTGATIDRIQGCIVSDCIFYSNGGNGLQLNSTCDGATIIGCTSYGNTGDGFQIDDDAVGCIFINNAACNNGGYGYDLQTKIIQPTLFFGYNHAFGNTGNGSTITHCTECLDTAFATFRHGNNQTGDPLFTNTGAGTENFTPLTGSDLINNALAPMSGANNAIGAMQRLVDYPAVTAVLTTDTVDSVPGTYIAVLPADVEAGVAVGVNPAVGTFVVPAVADVEALVEYGNAAEFVGELAGGGGGGSLINSGLVR